MKKTTVKLEDILYDAELAFWGKVVQHMPQIKKGKFNLGPIDESMVLLARMKYHGESGLPSSGRVNGSIKEDDFRDALEKGIKGWWWWNSSGLYDLKLRDGTVLKSRPLFR